MNCTQELTEIVNPSPNYISVDLRKSPKDILARFQTLRESGISRWLKFSILNVLANLGQIVAARFIFLFRPLSFSASFVASIAGFQLQDQVLHEFDQPISLSCPLSNQNHCRNHAESPRQLRIFVGKAVNRTGRKQAFCPLRRGGGHSGHFLIVQEGFPIRMIKFAITKLKWISKVQP